MDKKDIYEHLAKIYLDASSKTKRKKKTRPYHHLPKNLILASVILAFGFGFILFSVSLKKKPGNSEIALMLQSDVVKVNFNFVPAKKEIYTINLNRQNLSGYKALGFSVKKANYRDRISLRVEFTTAFREKAEIYFKDLSHKWQDYQINLAQFKSINDWSEILSLSFSVEEWNVVEKKGVVYIDNIRLVR